MAYNGFQNEVISLSVAQLASANSSPPVVISVPDGKIAQVLSAVMIRTAGTIPVANLYLRYTGTEVNTLNSALNMSGVAMRRAGDGFVDELVATLNGKDVVLWNEFNNTGVLLTATVANGGISWAVNDTFEVLSPDTIMRVTAQTGGAATAVEVVTSTAAGFTVGQTIPAGSPSGGGSGLTITVATITPANSAGILSVCYHLIPV